MNKTTTDRKPISIEIGSSGRVDFIPCHTGAPKAYDGFGTFTVQESGKNRFVLIRAEHFEWQTSRYSSGLYGCEVCDDDVDRYVTEKLWQKLTGGAE